MGTKYPQYPDRTDEQVEASKAAFHARRDAATQEMMDIIYESYNYLALGSRFMRDSNPGHADRMMALHERANALLDKIYSSKAV